jgi:hypothetical protein
MIMAEVGKTPGYEAVLAWGPAAAWLVAGGLLVVAAGRAPARRAPERG